MSVTEYLRHTYKLLSAATYAEAVHQFYAKYGYAPAPVFGPPGCRDALESNYVPAGFYACAVREESR